MNCKLNKYHYKILFILIVFICCLTPNLYGEDNMEPIYHKLNRAFMPKLEPQIYPIKEQLLGIMDFPHDNAIATNQLPGTNAITLITFNEEKLKVKYKTVAKNFIKYVGGGSNSYIPIFSEDMIGYGQTRGFTLLNIKTKKGISKIVGGMEHSFGDIHVIDPEKHIFLFAVYKSPNKFPDDCTFLHVTQFDLKNNTHAMLCKKETGFAMTQYSDNTIFLFKGNEVETLDINLEPTEHPFATKFNQEKKRFTKVRSEVVFHPNLPFAVFTDYETDIMWVISWEDRDNPVLHKIFNYVAYRFRFSYDGKWLQFQNTKEYMIMPVNPDLPHYLGKPIPLAGCEKARKYTQAAMTRNPSGLVVASDFKHRESQWLKKYDFTKAFELIEE